LFDIKGVVRKKQ